MNARPHAALAVQPERRADDSGCHLDRLQAAMLAALYDARRPMTAAELRQDLRCLQRDLWAAVRAQHNLGNLKRGEPIELTASARAAIAAGRLTSLDWRRAA